METIREYVIENFLFGDDSQLEEDTSFLESGIIDSTGIMDIIAFLESEFNIIIDDDEIIPENLDSLKSINEFLHRKLDGKQQQ